MDCPQLARKALGQAPQTSGSHGADAEMAGQTVDGRSRGDRGAQSRLPDDPSSVAHRLVLHAPSSGVR